MNIEAEQQSLLTFRIGPVLCCAPNLPVRSIITPPKLTRPPGSNSSQPGIFKHGSHIVKVLDLRQKFGIEQSGQTQPGNLIITIFEKNSFAFWVDQILDVFDFPLEGWGNLPAAIPRGVFSRTLLLNEKIHLYSEFEKLATINDLGYLKHYIQQLNQEKLKKTASKISETSDKKSTLKSVSQIKSDEEEQSPTSIVENNQITETKQHRIVTQPSSHDSSLEITTKKFNAQTEEKTAQKQSIKKISGIKEKIQPSATTIPVSRLHQQTISKKEMSKIPKPRFKPHTNVANKEAERKPFSNETFYSSKPQIDDKTKTSYTSIIIFFIFIPGFLGAGIYYLFAEDVASRYEYKKEKIVSHEFNFNTKKIKESKKEPVPEKKSIPEPVTSMQAKSDSIPEVVTAKTMIKEDSEAGLLDNENKLIENIAYRANITQLDNEITITIHKPVFEEKPQQPETTITPRQIKKDIKNEIVLMTPPEKIINEVIHTVVKGDTLWAIAKKYVNDPFLYPELAQLSNITNPHRIYPGNRVRIRFIKN